MELTICQYGVCTFKEQPGGTFLAQPFNFYIFGGDNDKIATNRAFTCSAKSIKFLRDNNFDFNKWIDNGIPFYNFSEEDTKYATVHGTSMSVRESQLLVFLFHVII
ncbi:CAF1-domain-containing protein [Backusella circina FSU 941]|nr:CAF1-domain-containing protein [Backusella circina FSU 941]